MAKVRAVLLWASVGVVCVGIVIGPICSISVWLGIGCIYGGVILLCWLVTRPFSFPRVIQGRPDGPPG